MTIFDPQFQFDPKREKKKKINQALEKVRMKYGEGIVMSGSDIKGNVQYDKR